MLPGGETVPLSTVLDTLELSGEVQGVTVSNPELFSCEMVDGVWTVFSHQPFQTDEWMNVTLDGIPYNIKVTDAEKHTVTFDMKGHATDKTPVPKQVEDGKPMEDPFQNTDDKKIDGLFLYKWYTNPNFSAASEFKFLKKSETNPTLVTEDITLYARWGCLLEYKSDHGTVENANRFVKIGEKANKKNAPTPEATGYNFVEWCTDQTYENAFNFDTPITTNIQLYAKLNPDLRILSGDGGTAHYGSSYPFTLNYSGSDYSKNSDKFKVFVAKEGGEYGEALSIDKYTVTPDSDKPVVVTLKDSYVETLADGTTYKIRFDTGLEDLRYKDGTFKVSKDPVVLCTVTYLNKVDGATPWPADTTVPQGTVLEEVKPIATGYRFAGWFDAATGGNAYTFRLPINADKTFYAHWTSLYDVTFIDMLQSYNIFRPTPNPIVDVPYGTVISRPDNEKDKKMSVLGYSFEGWYTGLKSSTPYNFSEGITGDTDIYAHWNSDLQILQQGYKYEKGSGTPSSKAYSNHNYYFLVNCNWKQVSVDNDNYKVYIDGTRLERNNYSLVNKEGVGTFVVLKNIFIKNNLSEGRHTFIFDTGIDPNNEFGIYLGSVEGTFDYSKAPKTGDESNVALWAAIAGVSLIAVVVITAVLLNKRKKGKKAPIPPETRSADKTRKPPKE